jgi:hypothetical protein
MHFSPASVVHFEFPTFRQAIALQLLQIVMVMKRLLRLFSVLLSY